MNTLAGLSSSKVNQSKLWSAALLAGLASAAANIVVLLIAQMALGPVMGSFAGPGTEPVALGAVQVGIASLVPALGAALLLAGLARFTRQPWPIFHGVSAVFLLVSMAGPANLGLPAGFMATLIFMHVVAGALIVVVLGARARA